MSVPTRVASPAHQPTIAASRAFPVVELFGPTVQGEGPDAGRPAYFVRFGGCDFRCSWCDSMYAVEPAEVREHAEKLDAQAIRARLGSLAPGPRLVVLTGGNPALHELGELTRALQADGFEVAVETQGSVYRPWLATVDRLVVSPKPPSSGLDGELNRSRFTTFLTRARADGADPVLKIVVFDQADLDYARAIGSDHPELELHLSVGTPVGADDDDPIDDVIRRLRWLTEAAAATPELAGARVLPQLHVLAWGRARGV
jgi:7-carboxy-7-deazaguanine synthase